MTRDEALNLMREWVKSESLRKHMLTVEAAMAAYANKFGESIEDWSVAGLLHDFDYEKYPEYDVSKKSGHPYEGVNFLRSNGCSEDILNAILGHAQYSNTPRESLMAKCLFACDELCGFIVACGYLRPDRLTTLNASSVNKRLKDKRFAAKVSREDIDLGIKELGVNRDEHIDFVISALRNIQNQIFDN